MKLRHFEAYFLNKFAEMASYISLKVFGQILQKHFFIYTSSSSPIIPFSMPYLPTLSQLYG